MPRERTSGPKLEYLHYTQEDFKRYVDRNLDGNQSFLQHCTEAANNCNVHPDIVRDLLKDHAVQTLVLLQEKALKNQSVKINITGYFSLATQRLGAAKFFRKIKKTINKF